MGTETDLANIALGKIGGAGDALSGNAFISSIDGTDKVSTFCKFSLPRVRRRVIIDLASRDCPFRETIRFADLGSAIDSDDLPEIGQYDYAFNIPSDCLIVIRQFDEGSIATRLKPADYVSKENTDYQWEIIANAEGNGSIILTDTLSNYDGDSAFVEYSIDITSVNSFSEQLIDCIATLLASELCPVIGRDMESRVAMTQEYYQKSIPDAKRVNQKGYNNSARAIDDYKGGRL